MDFEITKLFKCYQKYSGDPRRTTKIKWPTDSIQSVYCMFKTNFTFPVYEV